MYTNEELEILPSDKLTADKPSDDTELSGAKSGLASSLLLQSTDTFTTVRQRISVKYTH